jgi:ribose transport system ATP-binding protein
MSTLELSGIVKRYGATVALNGASLCCASGQVHALLGENGAGKSTMVKILGGIVQADAGSIRIAGAPVALTSARAAQRAGIAIAFQELSLIRDLTVAQNLLLGREPLSRLRLVARRRLNRAAARLLDELEIAGVDPDEMVRELPLPVQQKIEIARALAQDPQICLLDEPTSALAASDVDWLFGQVRRLRERGKTVIYITHRLPEVRALCDCLTILRNGSVEGTFPTSAISDAEVIRLMIGRALASSFPPKRHVEGRAEAPVLEVRHLRRAPDLQDVSLAVAPRDIVGVAALQGHGQETLFLSIFGARDLDAGAILVDGRPARINSPVDAVHAGLRISLVPGDRKTEGLFLALSGTQNLTISSLRRFSRLGWMNVRKEQAWVQQVLEQLRVQPSALHAPVEALSGGNQQKIVIGKWLLPDPRVLLMFDPTRGVDVGTKHDIYVLMRDYAAAGKGILFYSTDIPELVNVCDRVIVLYRGKVACELAGADLTAERVLAAMLGDVGPQAASPLALEYSSSHG